MSLTHRWQHLLRASRLELPALAKLAGPLIAAQMAQVAMVFTDTLMMGRVGAEALAGGALGGSLYNFLFICASGVLAGVANGVAIRHGANDRDDVRGFTQAGVWLALMLAGGNMLLLALAFWLLPLAGLSTISVSGGLDYLSSLIWAMPAALLFVALRGFAAGLGHAGPIMHITLLGALLNLLLNWLFIELGWGLFGIGLATTLVMTGMALTLMLFLRRSRRLAGYDLLGGLSRWPAQAMRALLALGLPIGGTYAVETSLFFVAALAMGYLGDLPLAAHQIAVQAVYVAFMVPVGISYAATIRIGQHFGAGRLQQALITGRLAIGGGALLMLSFAGLFWLWPEGVVGMFIDLNNPANRELAVLATSLLAIAAWFELFDGSQCIAMGCLRGLGQSRWSFAIGAVGYCLLGIPAALALGFLSPLGAEGIWWGMALGLSITAVGLIVAFERLLHQQLQLFSAGRASYGSAHGGVETR